MDFQEKEATSFEILKANFGEKLVNHLVVVFSGGDELQENNMKLEDYLGHESSPLAGSAFMNQIILQCHIV